MKEFVTYVESVILNKKSLKYHDFWYFEIDILHDIIALTTIFKLMFPRNVIFVAISEVSLYLSLDLNVRMSIRNILFFNYFLSFV